MIHFPNIELKYIDQYFKKVKSESSAKILILNKIAHRPTHTHTITLKIHTHFLNTQGNEQF